MATAVEDTPKTTIHVWRPVGEEKPIYGGNNLRNYIGSLGLPVPTARLYKCEVEIAPGVVLTGYEWGPYLFVQDAETEWHPWTGSNSEGPITTDEPFFTARLVSKKAYAKTVSRTKYRQSGPYAYNQVPYKEDEVDEYIVGRSWWEGAPEELKVPYAYLQIEVAPTDGSAEPVLAEFRFKQPRHGVAKLSDDPTSGDVTITSKIVGMSRTWTEWVHHHVAQYRESGRYERDFSNDPLFTLCYHLNHSDRRDEPDEWWRRFLEGLSLPAKPDTRGVISVLGQKAIAPNIERLKAEAPMEHRFLTWLFDGNTKDKRKNNSLIATFLKEVGPDYKKLKASIRKARLDSVNYDWGKYYDGYFHYGASLRDYFEFRRWVCLNLPGAQELVRQQDAKADYTKRKTTAGKAEGLGIDKTRYPALFRYVEAGTIPISVFAQPDKTPVNREFALWEKALKRKGWADDIVKIATDASRRSTYEKDITPYLSFLFKIEKYLRRHTKKPWKAVPKYVESQWELEMDEPTADGTTKRRSAFTPVADNETRVVTVPYVAVVVGGRRAQWCYSKHYYVFEENTIDAESGGVVVNELEEKLNGRDDYGLMYFTLTGTVTARGYPTFLVIFERLKAGTRVHFHRVHPKRRVNGVATPACHLIERCYQYMAGNVPAEDVTAQQGDMIYIRLDNDPVAAGAKVEDPLHSKEALVFESHAMIPLKWDTENEDAQRMSLYPSAAKTPKNRLGFLHVPGAWCVKHPEHDDIDEMGPGWWEIRRARSWEANPTAIWSLTID